MIMVRKVIQDLPATSPLSAFYDIFNKIYLETPSFVAAKLMTLKLEYAELHIDEMAIQTDLSEVLGYLSGNGETPDQHTLGLSKKLMADCRKVMTPGGAFVIAEALPVRNKDDIAIPGMQFNTGTTIVKMLKGASYFVFFIATAGPGPENLSRGLMEEGHYLEGYIADLIASGLVEATAQYIHDHLKERMASQGLRITNRYSPGYCGWKVDEQQKLFDLFPSGSCGITLSESSLMSPIKSVSCILGAGPDVGFRDYTCELCSMKDCSFRKTRHTKA